MKRTFVLVFSTLLLCSGALLAQLCGADQMRQNGLQSAEIFQRHQALEQAAYTRFSAPAQARGSQILTVPVVVHIIHDNGPENISDAAAAQAIDWLNDAFANAGYYDQGSGVDAGIRFCMAQRTPGGQATNGITRDQSPLTVFNAETQEGAMKNINRWEPEDYLNIWVVRDICSSVYGCGLVAYAYNPAFHGSGVDGVVIEAGFLNSAYNTEVLAHEAGHYFGLYHTFEGACTNNDCLLDGDRVCDTPPDQSTAAVPCDQPVNTCITDAQSGLSSDLSDMLRNHMDYGHLDCKHDFTQGQADRMNFFLNGARQSLLSSKGCLPPCPLPTLAAFSPGDTTIQAGQTLFFDNNSQNAVNFSWTLDGTPFGSQQNAAYTFNTAGVFTIKLTAQALNAQLCDAASTQITVQVLCEVTAGFTLGNLSPEEGQTVTVTNTSQNAVQYEWFIDGVSQGSTLDSVVFGVSGFHEIRLLATGAICSDALVQSVFVRDSCSEKTLAINFVFADENSVMREIQGSAALSDGSLVIAGSTNISPSATGPSWIFLQKIDPEGGTQWIQDIGNDGSGFFTRCPAIAAMPDGGFVALFYRAPLLPDTLAANYLIKFSTDGSVVWFHKLNEGTNTGDLYGDLSVAPNGDIYVDTQLKFDANGNLLWSQAFPFYGETNTFPYPGGGIISMTTDASGNAQIVRLDAGANVLWCNNFDLEKTTLLDVAAAPDGSIFALGRRYTLSVAGVYHTVLLKLSPEGNILWTKRYFRTETSWFDPRTFTVAPDGGITLAARSSVVTPPSSIQQYNGLLHTDAEGNVLWVRHVEEDRFLMDELFSISGGYLARCGFGWAKADPLGYVGTCESTPYSIQRADVPASFVAIPAAGFPVPLNLQAGDLPVTVFPLSLLTYDTGCAPACPRGVEICNNSLDDDEDGLFDCLDPDCNCPVDVCRPGNANIWYFGDKAGLDFNTEPPTVLTDGQAETTLQTTVVCDPQGNLLFYANDQTVYNRFHEPMPNGSGMSQPSTAATVIALPHPGEPGLYYLFICNTFGPGYYSLIDMKLDGGKGDVVAGNKSLVLAANYILHPRLIATRACGFDGYWLIAEDMNQANQFLAFRIDEDGLDPTPVISFLGGANSNSPLATLKCSPNGKFLARSSFFYSNRPLKLFKFNPANGAVTDSLNLTLPFYRFIGLEYSADSRYLYVTAVHAASSETRLLQFDLASYNLDQITGSLRVIASRPYALLTDEQVFGALQLAPNGKIYAGNNWTSKMLNVIHRPDLPGSACQFQENAVSLPGSAGSLVNIVQSYVAAPVSIALAQETPDTVCTPGVPLVYHAATSCSPFDSITWNLEGLQGTVSPVADSAFVTFNAPGEGRLIVTKYSSCGTAADTLHIVVTEPFNKILDLGPDRVVCDNGVFTFHAGSGFARYRWQNGTPDSVLTTLLPGLYWVDVWDACGHKQTDSVRVSFAPATVLDLGPDQTDCDNFSATFSRPAFFDNWLWDKGGFISCDTCATVVVSPAASTSWVVVAQTEEGCISVDTLVFTLRDTLFFKIDTSICIGQALDIFGVSLPPDTTASFFFQNAGPGCDTLFSVQVTGIDAPFTALEAAVCPGQTYLYNGVEIPADTTLSFFFPGSGVVCDSTVVLRVNALPPLSLGLPPDTTLRIGATLLLETDVQGEEPLILSWSPSGSLSCSDCPAPTATPAASTPYTLQVSDANGCTAQDSVLVSVDPLCVVIIPNAFTPNGDGLNDRFFPKTDPCVRRVLVWRIVSRWGETVFESRNAQPNDPAYSWDGNRADGAAFPSDVLVWYAELEYHDGRREVRKGDVALLR